MLGVEERKDKSFHPVHLPDPQWLKAARVDSAKTGAISSGWRYCTDVDFSSSDSALIQEMQQEQLVKYLLLRGEV